MPTLEIVDNRNKFVRLALPALLILTSVVLGWMAYGHYMLAQLSYQFPSLNFAWSLPSLSVAQADGTVQPAELVIPKIRVQAPIQRGVPVSDQSVYDAALQNGVALASSSATLEAAQGNSFIFGHSSFFSWDSHPYDTVFALLPKLVTGDTVQIVSDGQTADYKVTLSKSISPTEVQYLDDSPDRELTMVTCWPVGTNLKRWVVRAVKST